MFVRTIVRLHVLVVVALAATGRRLAARPQGGQATVEYVALILLVAAVLAAAVAAANSSKFNLETTVTDQLKKAIGKVSGR